MGFIYSKPDPDINQLFKTPDVNQLLETIEIFAEQYEVIKDIQKRMFAEANKILERNQKNENSNFFDYLDIVNQYSSFTNDAIKLKRFYSTIKDCGGDNSYTIRSLNILVEQIRTRLNVDKALVINTFKSGITPSLTPLSPLERKYVYEFIGYLESIIELF